MFERVETTRLVLCKPERGDAAAIFARYASDAEVTRWLAWPRHTTLQTTYAFLDFSDSDLSDHSKPANGYHLKTGQ